jgi:hypothetical protein
MHACLALCLLRSAQWFYYICGQSQMARFIVLVQVCIQLPCPPFCATANCYDSPRLFVVQGGICYNPPCQGITLVQNGVPVVVPRNKYFEGLMGLSYESRWESLGWLAFINFIYVLFILGATRYISHQKK